MAAQQGDIEAVADRRTSAFADRPIRSPRRGSSTALTIPALIGHATSNPAAISEGWYGSARERLLPG